MGRHRGAFDRHARGAALFGLIITGFIIPGRHATHLTTALEAIPGALIGIPAVYFEGSRRERASEAGGSGYEPLARTAAAVAVGSCMALSGVAAAATKVPGSGHASAQVSYRSGPLASSPSA